MTERCFISHSSTDARGFASRLTDALESGKPPVPVWLDQRDMRRGMDFDLQIDQALKTCRLVLYLMTPDRVSPLIRSAGKNAAVPCLTERQLSRC